MSLEKTTEINYIEDINQDRLMGALWLDDFKYFKECVINVFKYSPNNLNKKIINENIICFEIDGITYATKT